MFLPSLVVAKSMAGEITAEGKLELMTEYITQINVKHQRQ